MNQDWQEKAIRQLYRDQRQADESLAPHFAASLEAALSKRRKDRSGRLIFRLAIAVVALVAVAGLALLLRGGTSREQAPLAVMEPSESGIKPPATPREPSSASTPSPPKPPRRARSHRPSPGRETALISQWRSPTDFLLRTPGDELLRSVPRVGASAVKINLNLSSFKN